MSYRSHETVHSTRYTLDPNIIGTAANIIEAVQGTVATTGSAPTLKWRLNADEYVLYDPASPILDIEFPITVPVKPTAGDVRAWGFKTPGLLNRGRIEFDITATVFSCLAYDEDGTQLTVYNTSGAALSSGAYTWDDTNWTNKEIKYRIINDGKQIKFLVEGTVIAQTQTPCKVSTLPTHVHLRNDNADNMDLKAIIVRNSFNL